MSDHDDAKAPAIMIVDCLTESAWLTEDERRLGIRWIMGVTARITDLETQVRGDAEKLQAAVDTEVKLRTRIGELEAALLLVKKWDEYDIAEMPMKDGETWSCIMVAVRNALKQECNCEPPDGCTFPGYVDPNCPGHNR